MTSPILVDERTLVIRVQAGDREAFGTLVQLHMRRAYFGALGLVGSHDEALDLSQEAFARAFRARNSIDPERPFYTWFYQILRRLCFNHVRDHHNRRRLLEAASGWLVDDATRHASRSNPDRQFERRELRESVEAAIEELPAREREMLVLKEFEGLRYKEIAELLEIPIGTVMSRLYTARRKLAEKLGDRL